MKRVIPLLIPIVLLVGAAFAIVPKTIEVYRRPCQAGVREQDCGMYTDYQMGLRAIVMGTAVLAAVGLWGLYRVKRP